MNNIVNSVIKFLKSNSPAIMTAIGVTGTITTAVLAGKASYDAALDIKDEEAETLRDKVELVWPRYIPAVISGGVTIGCIIGASRVSSRRALAAAMAYSVAEQTFAQYKDKVVEVLGERKEQEIRDKIVTEKILKNPPPKSEIVLSGPGNVLCCEGFTGRYFQSDMESLRRAMNDLNARILTHDMASLDDWYDMIGLQPTQFSSDIGWTTPKLMELNFTSVLAEDGRPCLAFEYNYTAPLYDGLRF